jgi:hypothetical protein
MYEHMVFFKFNNCLTPEKENELLAKLKAFKGVIPGIIDLTTGVNVTEEEGRAQGFSLGLRVTFIDKEALIKYGPHPIHQDFVQSLKGVIEDVIVVDYPL